MALSTSSTRWTPFLLTVSSSRQRGLGLGHGMNKQYYRHRSDAFEPRHVCPFQSRIDERADRPSRALTAVDILSACILNVRAWVLVFGPHILLATPTDIGKLESVVELQRWEEG